MSLWFSKWSRISLVSYPPPFLSNSSWTSSLQLRNSISNSFTAPSLLMPLASSLFSIKTMRTMVGSTSKLKRSSSILKPKPSSTEDTKKTTPKPTTHLTSKPSLPFYKTTDRPSKLKKTTTQDLLSENYTPSPLRLIRPPRSPVSSRSSSSSSSFSSSSAFNKHSNYKNLESLGFDTTITEAMKAVIQKCHQDEVPTMAPTEIQILAAQHYFKHHSINNFSPSSSSSSSKSSLLSPVVLAAETGSGKTLAYLSCIMQHLKLEEQMYDQHYQAYLKQQQESIFFTNILPLSSSSSSSTTSTPLTPTSAPKLKKPISIRRLERPRAIILVPTLDLLEQVGKVAKEMSHQVKLRTVMFSTSTPSSHVKRILSEPIDLLVTTPGTLQKYLKEERLSLAETTMVVLDEADFLIDQGFDEETKATCFLLNTILNQRARQAYLFAVSATIPYSLIATLSKWLHLPSSSSSSSLPILSTSQMHRSLPKCQHVFVRAVDKYQSLWSVLQQHATPNHPMLIFCNTLDHVDQVYAFLHQTKKLPNVYKLLGVQSLQERRLVWQQFYASPNSILVCTDMVSRGLDTLTCKLVINFDFPSSVLQYLHRIGRTARAGRKGKAVHLVAKRDQRLVYAIQQRLKLKKDFSVS